MGLISTLMISLLFANLVEVPLSMLIPYYEILYMLTIVIVATIMAVSIPARKLNAKQISSVLRGIAN